jgi:hypothetical protein
MPRLESSCAQLDTFGKLIATSFAAQLVRGEVIGLWLLGARVLQGEDGEMNFHMSCHGKSSLMSRDEQR